jgi:hypothetical protein
MAGKEDCFKTTKNKPNEKGPEVRTRCSFFAPKIAYGAPWSQNCRDNANASKKGCTAAGFILSPRFCPSMIMVADRQRESSTKLIEGFLTIVSILIFGIIMQPRVQRSSFSFVILKRT